MVGKSTEQFDNILLLVAVLVCADVYSRTAENGIGPFKILDKYTIYERNNLRIGKIQMINTELLASKTLAEMCKCQGMCRYVDFGNYLDPQKCALLDKRTELSLGVMSVACS